MSNYYWKKKLDELEKENAKSSSKSTTTSTPAYYWQNKLNELENEKNDDIAPVHQGLVSVPNVSTRYSSDNPISHTTVEKTPWYKSGEFADGYQFGDVTKFILGVDSDKKRSRFTGVVATDETSQKLLEKYSLDELKAKAETAKTRDERVFYIDLANQKEVAEAEAALSKITMEDWGKPNVTVLDEMIEASKLEKGDEKDERLDKVFREMIVAGYDPNVFYSLLTGDKNVSAKQVGQFVKNIINTGLNNFNTSLTGLLDLTLGAGLKAVGWENNPVAKLDEYYTGLQTASNYDLEMSKARMGLGGWGDGVANLGTGIVEAAPHAILAIMSSGASEAGSLSTTAARSSGTVLQNVGITSSQMLKNPSYWMSYATTYEGNYEDAINNGANDMEAAYTATLTSLINANIEMGGGIQKLPGNLSSGKNSAVLDFVKSSLEEGGEEVLQGIVLDTVAKANYDEDRQILDGGEMLQEFGMGTAVGAALSGGQVGVQSAINASRPKETTNPLTENEQKVVDKVYQGLVDEAEKDGNKLTQREKTKLYDDVLNQMEKGYISTDTIEEVLGGETYKTYKDTIDSEDAQIEDIKAQIKELENAPNTIGNSRKYDALQSQLEELTNNSQRSQLKTQLGEEVFSLVRDENGSGSRLLESYNEKGKRSQAFEADLSQYDEKQQAVIQKAVDSGILNNTRRTHEFVDMVAKISADKGVLFEFTNNEKLKDSSFAVDGKQVNGFVTKDGITLNINSAKSLNKVVGHEITHILEGTELYNELQSTITEYAKSKGDYQSRYDALLELYKNIEGADIDAELTADLVGDYIFTDTDFVKNLSVKHRNVFQKIYDEIKYLLKVATAGSKEARELEKVKKVFDNVYRENGKASKDTKYSLGYHAGDLGKAEGYWNMMSSNRGTGHFGTGTYFVGDEAKINDKYYGNRPHEKVEFDNYNLFKPLYEGEGFELHSALKYINDNIHDYPIAKMSFDERWDVRKKVDEAEYTLWDDDATEAEKAAAQKTLDDFKERFESVGYDPDRMDAQELYEELDDISREYHLTRSKLGMIFAKNMRELSYDEQGAKIDSIMQGIYDEVSQIEDAYAAKHEDSPSTRFVKALGYEGIDVRGFKNLDNTTYGSVIYDLKGDDLARKKEIGTAKYSLSDSETDNTYLEAVKNRDWDTAQKLVDEAAEKSGYTKVVYHGTDARFTEFDTDEESTAREQHAWMADYPDGTIFLAEDYDVADGYGERVMNLLLDTSDVKVFEEPDMYAHRAMDDKYGYEVYNYPVIAVKGKDMTIYATLDNTAVKSADTVTYDDNGEVIPLSERFKHSNPDIRYSLSEDSEGREVSPAVAKRFGNSKAVDENGNLKVLYHGTAAGEFSIFDKTKGSVEGDYGSGFYFTDNSYDVENNYEGGGPDFENKVSRRAEEIYGEEDIEFEEAERRAREELFKGSHLFEVYLNIENPAIVGETILFDNKSYYGEYDQDDYDSEDDYYGDVEQLIADDIDNIIWDIERNVDVNSTDGIADVLWGAFNEGGIDLEHLKARINNLYLEDSNGNLAGNEVTRQIIESLGYDGIIDPTVSTKWNMSMEEGTTHYIVFKPNQIKAVTNQNPTDNPDIHRSLSEIGETPTRHNRSDVLGEDIALEEAPEVAPVTEETEEVTEETPVTQELFPDDVAPTQKEYSDLLKEKNDLESRMLDMSYSEDFSEFDVVTDRYVEVMSRLDALDKEVAVTDSERTRSLNDSDIPPEMEAPYPGESSEVTVDNPFENRDWYEVGKNRKMKAYMYENPEVKPFFQEEARGLLMELNDTTKGERWYNDELYYESGGEKGWGGTKRHTSDSIAELLDSWHMSYADIERGLNAIIEDNGAENNAASKKIEFMLNDRLLRGYKDFYSNSRIPPNQEYINLLNEKQINAYSEEAFNSLMATADQYAPVEEVAPIKETAPVVSPAKTVASEAIKPKPSKEPRMAMATPAEQARADILTEEPKATKKKGGVKSWIKNNVIDKGMVFEDLALKTKNRELQARWNSIRYAEGKAQRLVGNGNEKVKSLNSIREKVEKTGKTKQFYEYLYHRHNVDRMTLEERFKDTPNKPVFGESVTADVSRAALKKLEMQNPRFKQYAQEVYGYMTYLREELVKGGVISKETAKLWQTMYPNYVPIRRAGDTGLNINVPLDTRRTGVNAPIKKATGGSRDILPLFDTMGQRTIQTYKAIAKNRFGVELKNTLRSAIGSEVSGVDDVIDSIDTQDGLLQEGKNGKSPTFTVFENGKKVTFEITDEMYDAMKPTSDALSYTNKVANTISNIRRGTLTEYNPWFLLKNAVKDVQDVLINSQHPAKTYAAIPKAIKQMAQNGQYYQEYLDNGGEQNTYFDRESNTFKQEMKIPGLYQISQANNVVERLPRLAEYIASRESGSSIDVAMLDAARVTTNFAAGGDLTKMLNRNGATFLNASVQGAVQQARNIREAKMNGLKGWASLAGKYVIAGLPAVLLNGLIWDDDEEYEELSDYVKQNYYIVGKFGDGKFVRIPKGRTVAVIQNAFEQMGNLITGDDEADLGTFLDLVVSNLAPNNPLDNNILSPIIQTARNKTWYGEDLVPTRLQDLPAAEQYDESTDSISKWLGETFNVSPYKTNYLLDQYSGVIGDTFLPMLTPEAESGNDSFLGNMIAPLKDMFTTDSVMKNQNVSDFYTLKDELTVNANASGATDEDKLMSKYINSVNAELSELYQQKREIQNSNLSDKSKYEKVRDIQQQIVELTKEGMSNYQDISYEDEYRGGGEYVRVSDRLYKLNDDGQWQKLTEEQQTKYEVTKAAGYADYATDGTNHYRWYVPGEDAGADAEPGWRTISEKELQRQKEVTRGLGISAEEYWGNREEYTYAYEHPENYAVAKAVGGYDSYRTYSSELYDIKADKDSNGKSISGSRKEKVLDYINNLDADYYEKIILWKSEYPSDDTYNYEIIDYLNGRDDISYAEMKSILLKLGFNVDSNGNISW